MGHIILNTIWLGLAFLTLIKTSSAEGYYSLNAPGTLHSGKKFSAAIGVHQTDKLSQVKVSISGPSYNASQVLDLQPNQLKTVDFNVPRIPFGKYDLEIEGLSGIGFKNKRSLIYNDVTPFAIIQTDREIYKPGDDINFRILFLDEHLRPEKPHNESTVSICLNQICELIYTNLTTVNGVFTGKYRTQNYGSQGKWVIEMNNGGISYAQRDFEVFSIEPHKFSITLDMPFNVCWKDDEVIIIVRANYAFGKPVTGNATLTAHFTNTNLQHSKDIIQTVKLENGKGTFQIKISDYRPPNLSKKTQYDWLELDVKVEEEYTGIHNNKKGNIGLSPNKYTLKCLNYNTCHMYKPDRIQEITWQIINIDGTAFTTGQPSEIILRYKEYIDHYKSEPDLKMHETELKTYEFKSKLNETGFAVFQVNIPQLSVIKGFNIKFEMVCLYDEEELANKIYIINENESTTPATPFFRVHSLLAPEIGAKTVFSVESSEAFDHILYTVVARGNIVHSERVNLLEKATNYNLSILILHKFSPQATLTIYYVDNNGTLHQTQQFFQTKVVFENQIEISAPSQVGPGDKVTLNIKTPKNSFVGLQAIDQRLMSLKSIYNIDEYDYSWLLGLYTSHTIITLTNAIYETPDDSSARSYGESFALVGHGRPSLPNIMEHIELDASGNKDGNNLFERTELMEGRKHFFETWLFDSIESTVSDDFMWSKKIPDSITSWYVSGFSLNEEKGLGFSKYPSMVTTFQPFFITVSLPLQAKRGEELTLVVLVYNYLDNELDVKVTLDNVDNDFDFIDESNDVIDRPNNLRIVQVLPNCTTGATYKIRPKLKGSIMIKISAISALAGDTVIKFLNVIPEGVPETISDHFAINLNDPPAFKKTIEVPSRSVVPQSEQLHININGNFLNYLQAFEDKTFGIMRLEDEIYSHMMIYYIILTHLKSENKFTTGLENYYKDKLKNAYRRVLSYRHNDGSFSSKENHYKSLNNGTMLLTALSLRMLYKSEKFISVDTDITDQALRYLISKQTQNGSFIENSNSLNPPEHILLTAYILFSIVEEKELNDTFRPEIEKTIKYLLDYLNKENNDDMKSIIAFALGKAMKAGLTFSSHRSASSPNPRGRLFWSHVKDESFNMCALFNFNPVHVMMSNIMDWVESGSFPVMDIYVKTRGATNDIKEIIKLNTQKMIQLNIQLSPGTQFVDFEAYGKGNAIISVTHKYHRAKKEEPETYFNITTNIDNTDDSAMKMNLCFTYIGHDYVPNIIFMKIVAPNGYFFFDRTIEELNNIDKIKFTELSSNYGEVTSIFQQPVKNETYCMPIVFEIVYFQNRRVRPYILLVDFNRPSVSGTLYYDFAKEGDKEAFAKYKDCNPELGTCEKPVD